MPYCYLNVIADVNNFYQPTPILLSGDFQNLRRLVKSLSTTFISEFDKTDRSMYLFVAPLAQVINLFEEAGFVIFSINKNEKRNIWILHKEDKKKAVLNCEKHVDIALSTEDLVIDNGLIEDCPQCKRVFFRKQGGHKKKISPYRSEPLVLHRNQFQQNDQNCSYEKNNFIISKKLDQNSVVNCSDNEGIPSILTMMNSDENKCPEKYQINFIETVPAHNDNMIFIPSTNLLNQCTSTGTPREQDNSSVLAVTDKSYDPILDEEKPISSLPGKPVKKFQNKEICVRETSIDNNLVRMIIEKNNFPTKRCNLLSNENNSQREEKNPRFDSSESNHINYQPESPGIRPKYFESLSNALPKKVNNVELNKCQDEIISRNEEDDPPTKDTKQTCIKTNYSTSDTGIQNALDNSIEQKFGKYTSPDESTESEFLSETLSSIRSVVENGVHNFSQKVKRKKTSKFNRESDMSLEALKKTIRKYQEKYKYNDCNTSDASPSRESSYSYFDTRSHESMNSTKNAEIEEEEKCETPPFKEPVKMNFENFKLAPDETDTLQRNHVSKFDKKPKYNFKEINTVKIYPPSRLFTLNRTFKNSTNDKTNKVSVKSVSAEDKNYLKLSQRRQLSNAITSQSSQKEFVNKKISNFLTGENSISKGMRLDQNNEFKPAFISKIRVPNVKEKARSTTFSRQQTKHFY